jgi:hypothetical protein
MAGQSKARLLHQVLASDQGELCPAYRLEEALMPDRNTAIVRFPPAPAARRLTTVMLTLASFTVVAQPKAPATRAPFPAVMLSDLHFDPLRDPAKVSLLIKVPVTQWESILSTPDSPEHATKCAVTTRRRRARSVGQTGALKLDNKEALVGDPVASLY